MATLEQRIAALEQAQKAQSKTDPQFDADVQTTIRYFYANDTGIDLLPPEHFSEGERKALEVIILLPAVDTVKLAAKVRSY